MENDKEFQKVIRLKDISPATKQGYADTVTDFCKAIGKTYTEIVLTLKEQQYDKIENNRIIRYDAEQGMTKEVLSTYFFYMKEKGNKNSSINQKMRIVRTILKESGIILPKWKKLSEEKKKNIILMRKDLKYILDMSNIHQKALFTFLLSTGIRVSDALNFSIEDFIMSTYRYHNCVTLEEFLEKADEENMIGFWEFIPNKTKKAGIVCKVCNSQESSKYLIQSLKERVRLINQLNKKLGTNYELEPTDSLFASMKKHYKGSLTRHGVNSIFREKEEKLLNKKKEELLASYKHKEITQKEYREKLNSLPEFYPHCLRHYFISHLRFSGINMQIALLMEAHSSPIKTDRNYVGENEELFSEENIRQEYKKLINRVTVEKKISFDEYEKLIKTNQKYVEVKSMLNGLYDIYDKISDDSILKRVKL